MLDVYIGKVCKNLHLISFHYDTPYAIYGVALSETSLTYKYLNVVAFASLNFLPFTPVFPVSSYTTLFFVPMVSLGWALENKNSFRNSAKRVEHFSLQFSKFIKIDLGLGEFI